MKDQIAINTKGQLFWENLSSSFQSYPFQAHHYPFSAFKQFLCEDGLRQSKFRHNLYKL